MTDWRFLNAKKFPNYNRVRILKYWLVKHIGIYTNKFCARARDWRITKIVQLRKIKPFIVGGMKDE